jgi:ubiquitin carboxyl-terminal hydrolase 47
VQLPIRNDFDNIKNSSMEEAFQNLINPEILEGDNEYECDYCKKKVKKASKGQKFKKLPKILVIQLMRFVFDFTT